MKTTLMRVLFAAVAATVLTGSSSGGQANTKTDVVAATDGHCGGSSGWNAGGKGSDGIVVSRYAISNEGEEDGLLRTDMYVQDGLVAMWDGIDNGGDGVHVDVATSGWMDIVGGVVLTKANGEPVTDEKGVSLGSKVRLEVYDENGPATALGRVLGSTVKTIEIAGCDGNGATILQNQYLSALAGKDSSQYGDRLFLWYGDADAPLLGSILVPNASDGVRFYTGNDFRLTPGKAFSAAAVFPSSEKFLHYSNGKQLGSLQIEASARADKNCAAISLHGWYGKDGTEPPIYVSSIRVYNRALTAQEIVRNHCVDAARFRGAAGDVRYQDGRLQVRVRATSSDPDGCVAVDGNEGVSAEAWVDLGAEVTIALKQTPAGKSFYRWAGLSDLFYDEQVKISAIAPCEVTAMFGSKDWTYADGRLTNGDWTFAASGASGSISVGKPITSGSVGLVDLSGVITCSDGTGTIVSLADEMLRLNEALESLRIPTSVTTIPQRMAAQCPNLARVVLHDGIVKICHRAFRDTPKLVSFTPMLPKSIIEIGVYAFQSCPSLTETVRIPAALTSCNIADAQLKDAAYFDQSGFKVFEIARGAKLPERLLAGAVASIEELRFGSVASWVSGADFNSTFEFDPSRDKRVKMEVPPTSFWNAWMSNPDNVEPWSSCSEEDRQIYFDAFGQDAKVPFGLTRSAATNRRMWVLTRQSRGLLIFLF